MKADARAFSHEIVPLIEIIGLSWTTAGYKRNSDKHISKKLKQKLVV